MNIIKFNQVHLIFCIDCFAAFTYMLEIDEIIAKEEINRLEDDVKCGSSSFISVCSDDINTYKKLCESKCNFETNERDLDELKKEVLIFTDAI